MRFNTLLAALLGATTIVLSACTPSEPVISALAARQIQNALGYALAPAYLPEGFESAKTSGGEGYNLSALGDTRTATLPYARYSSDQQSTTTLILSYPVSYGKSSPMMERLGMTYPEDAVSEIRINGETAYLFRGRWTEDTLDRLARLTTPLNPEWDYDSGHISLRFAVVIPNGDRIWVSLATVFPTDQVTEKDFVRIAESVVVVD